MKLLKNPSFKSGFTLIELLLAIAVIAIISSTSFALVSKFSKQQSINLVYEDLKNNLGEAKSNSLSQVYTNCISDETAIPPIKRILIGYKVVFTDIQSYKVYEICSDNGAAAASIGNAVKSVDFSKTNVEFDTRPSEIQFKVLTGGVDNAADIVLTNGDSRQKKKVRVNSQGIIQEF